MCPSCGSSLQITSCSSVLEDSLYMQPSSGKILNPPAWSTTRKVLGSNPSTMVSSARRQTHAPVFPELSSWQTSHIPLLWMCTGLPTLTFNDDFLNEYQPKSTLLGTALRKRRQCYVTFPTLGVCRRCTKAAARVFVAVFAQTAPGYLGLCCLVYYPVPSVGHHALHTVGGWKIFVKIKRI